MLRRRTISVANGEQRTWPDQHGHGAVANDPRADLNHAVNTTEIPHCNRLIATASRCYRFGRALEETDGVPSTGNDSKSASWGFSHQYARERRRKPAMPPCR